MKKINKVTIKHTPDYEADLSYIGTFDSEPKSDLAIEHEPENNRSFNWFNPQPGTCENKKQAQAEYERMLAYDRGDWLMISVRAEAEILTSKERNSYSTINHVSSGGLWGIEYEYGEPNEHVAEIEKEQLDELADVLHDLGFTKAEITKAFTAKPVEVLTPYEV